MRDIATYTRVTPNQRIASLEKFSRNVNENDGARAILANWGLTLDNRPIELNIRQLEPEDVTFGRNKVVSAGRNANFSNAATSNHLLEVVNISNWLILHTRQDKRYADAFLDCMQRNATPMGISVNRPEVAVLDSDSTDSYVKELRKRLTSQVQIVVVMCPTSRDDRYAAIKKVCCSELPVPSQVTCLRISWFQHSEKNILSFFFVCR